MQCSYIRFVRVTQNIRYASPVIMFIDIQYLFKSTKQIKRKGESGFPLMHLFHTLHVRNAHTGKRQVKTV